MSWLLIRPVFERAGDALQEGTAQVPCRVCQRASPLAAGSLGTTTVQLLRALPNDGVAKASVRALAFQACVRTCEVGVEHFVDLALAEEII